MAGFFRRLFGGGDTPAATSQGEGVQSLTPGPSGVIKPKTVTADTALQVSAVFACVKLLSETVGSLPIKVYDTIEGGLEEDTTSRLSTLLGVAPNTTDTPCEFKETMLLNLMTNGNAYAEVARNTRGELISLEPLSAGQTVVTRTPTGVIYEYVSVSGEVRKIPNHNICHWRLMGNGVVGLNPIEYAAGTISNQLASEDFASRYFQSGAKPSGVLSTDMVMTDDQYAQVMGRFSNLSAGTDNAHRTLVLEAGMKYQQVQLTPESMQLLDGKRYNLEDIARFYGVPSILINDNTSTTNWGSGIEQIKLGWLSTGLAPLLTKIEQRLERSLLPPNSKKRIKFDVSGFLRADTAGMTSYTTQLVANGIISRNEARGMIDLAPVDGADELTAQINMAPVDQLNQTNEETSNANMV
tara:strand:- start:10720 stop:11952 length:1233 start_codon:yes stop_codon:yes gene_type:complete